MLSAYDFKNIILSRKGFDSASGFGYSPFDPKTGKYIVIPIPGGRGEQTLANRTKYEELQIKCNYLPGIRATNLRDLIFSDNLSYSKKTKAEISDNFAHVDPWLGSCPWLTAKMNHRVGAFGQVNAAQGHLEKNSVGVGSLFLFFSRFIPIKGRENRMGVPIDYKKGAYFLYGWLKVGRVARNLSEIQDEDIKARHPHATNAYFAKCNNNRIYISDSSLSERSVIKGCGYFTKLSKDLLLTSATHCQVPSVWELPAFFYEANNRPTYVQKESRWILKDGLSTCLVRAPARGQEFVFRSSPEFIAWFNYLTGNIGQVYKSHQT